MKKLYDKEMKKWNKWFETLTSLEKDILKEEWWRLIGSWRCTTVSLFELDEQGIPYPKEMMPSHKIEPFKYPLYDRAWSEFYQKVADKTVIDKGFQVRSLVEKATNNFYGLMGEKAVKDKLREMNVLYTYNEREPQFFKKLDKEPFDFAISTKLGEYITLEIKTTTENPKHVHMIVSENQWQKSDYFIAVKMLKLDTETEEDKIIGYGAFVGYMTKEDIEALPLVEAGNYPCFEYDGRPKKLKDIPRPISELWEIIDTKAIKWIPKS